MRPVKGNAKISIALTERRRFFGNANPARRKIDTTDFPLGWAVTLCRFAATVGMIYKITTPSSRHKKRASRRRRIVRLNPSRRGEFYPA
ncbi:MAG: hypothetical protein LBP75_02485 [Planctomycetota bacterium]|jgi:hypothetical protein|nr:hypothetical protein [Planctomycetota bacterium]